MTIKTVQQSPDVTEYFTIKEAANYCENAAVTIKSWINHKERPLPVRRKNYHDIYIGKETLDTYQKAMRPKGRPPKLPSYQVLMELKKEQTAPQLACQYNVTESAVWAALRRGKKPSVT